MKDLDYTLSDEIGLPPEKLVNIQNPSCVVTNQKPDKLDWEKELVRVWKKGLCKYNELKNLIRQLLARQKSATIEEIRKELKHIAMFDNGKFPKYLVKDILDILDNLNKVSKIAG